MGERRIGVAIDFSIGSRAALQWGIDNVVRKGDNLILITIRPEGNSEQTEAILWETTGSPLIPLAELSDAQIMKKYGTNPDKDTLDIVSSAATQKEITVLMKIYWGDPREKLCEAIESIPLDHLVIGNRGFGKLKRAIMGSVSNYVVNQSSCPVTVVKHGSS